MGHILLTISFLFFYAVRATHYTPPYWVGSHTGSHRVTFTNWVIKNVRHFSFKNV